MKLANGNRLFLTGSGCRITQLVSVLWWKSFAVLRFTMTVTVLAVFLAFAPSLSGVELATGLIFPGMGVKPDYIDTPTVTVTQRNL